MNKEIIENFHSSFDNYLYTLNFNIIENGLKELELCR